MPIKLAPPVRFESKETIDRFFDYAEEESVSPQLTNVVYPLLGQIFKPESIYEPGLPDQIKGHLGQDGLFALLMKHHTALDPVYVGATVPGSPLDQLRWGSVILAKAVLADNRFSGTILTKVGIRPVVRQRDHNNWRFRLIPEYQGANNVMRDGLIDHMRDRTIALGAHSFDADLHVASFIEGSRQGHESRSLEPENVHLGIAEMARQSINAHRIAAICVAVNSEAGHRHPIVAFSHFIEDFTGQDDATLKDKIAVGVQAADDMAALEAELRRPQVFSNDGPLRISWK